MAYEILIHGKPQALEYYGVQEDRDYIKSLYRSQDQPNQLMIATRAVGGRMYSYYHYLVYSNVLEYESNRKGSYMGISVRFDNYCLEARKVFTSLEFIYRNYCIGSIVQERGGMTTFMVGNFSEPSAQKRLASIKGKAEDLFQMSFSRNNFVEFGASKFVTLQAPSFVFRNIEECTEEQMLSLVQSGRALCLSGAFPSQALIQREKNLQGDMDKALANHKTEMTKRDIEFQSLKKKLEHTEDRIKSLSTEMEQYKSALGEVEKSISRFRSTPSKPFGDNAKTEDNHVSEKSTTQDHPKGISTNLLLMICTALIVVAIGIATYIGLPKTDKSPEPTAVQPQPQIVQSDKPTTTIDSITDITLP